MFIYVFDTLVVEGEKTGSRFGDDNFRYAFLGYEGQEKKIHILYILEPEQSLSKQVT